ncbi:hypothetical protein AMATHDRAFT_62260 [Amanita thiersii Skay4041]|uniref:Mid2 domain-containing protein n=1 Tax=Amanita thiersii Skay4041 TaxID=703135 RepID=A0A2A9NQB5_9AGAR|nr:hypothetical protein AMATHDRAFT_62260 [Amanita thiersii Skay4041]
MMTLSLHLIPLVLLQLIVAPTFSAAYTWQFDATPQQCKKLSISINGSGGKPPYRVLIIPFGPTPLANNVEVRTIMDKQFDDGSKTLSFQLPFPANSQFVAVVSDATGFGSGGTSVAAQVTDSKDASCIDPSKPAAPSFFFSIEPPNQIVQCQPTRIWWEKDSVRGTPNFLGVIPGGQSFTIPESKFTDVQSQGTGFSWTPPLRGGTTLMIVGGDNRGNGSAGSTLKVVDTGFQNDVSCLSNSSPSSTPGSPAGGSYPTSTSGNSAGTGGGSGGTNVGAIVGGIIGGLAVLIGAVLLFFLLRRRDRARQRQKERPVDLLNADDDEDDHPSGANDGAGDRSSRNDLPEYYRPQPYLVGAPTITDTDGRTDAGTELSYAGHRTTGSESRRLSALTSTSRSGTPDLLGTFGPGPGSTVSSSTRKGGVPRQYRAVNIIQHEDAGPSGPPPPADSEDPETIELPPAYTHIRPQ